MGCQSQVILGQNLTFTITTHDPDTSELTNADAAPAYRVYEDETATPLLVGTMTELDAANTTGFYSEQIACTPGNGFEANKSYNIYVEATVDGATGGISYGFAVMQDVADAVMDEALSGHTTSGTAGNALRRIGAGQITVTSPVATTGDIELWQGYDYYDEDGQALEWTDSDGSWPDLSGATPTFIIDGELSVNGTISNPTGPATITVELTRAQTAALPASQKLNYVVHVTTAGEHLIMILHGAVTVNRQRTAS